jgi:RHS repeat-associated protein
VLGERTKAGTTTYGYNQAGRLTSYTGANSAAYAYNGDGMRTSKIVGGATTTFVWDSAPTQNLLADGVNSYLDGPGGLPIEQIGAASFWFVHDQVGSTIGLLDSTGAVAATYSYSPYGTVTATGTAGTPLRYTGQYTEAESGLGYLRARYYDPATALFLTLDPMVDTTRAPYAYAGDNPVNYTDPTGKCSFWSCRGRGRIGGRGHDHVRDRCGVGGGGRGDGGLRWFRAALGLR